MTDLIQHPGEPRANTIRRVIATYEPIAQRTFTPTQTVISQSAGIYLWTPDGRRLIDFTSGVLVVNLGHHPTFWLQQFQNYLGWRSLPAKSTFCPAPPFTAYNAITSLEAEASERLIQFLRARPGGSRLEQVLWAASGSEAVQKALWAALARDPNRQMILATRHGFHGKKGLAGAVTGQESDHDRDPRVRFISFPMLADDDMPLRQRSFDPLPFRRELELAWKENGRAIGTLITEPYLGGGGSHHPPQEYLQLLQDFCREHDILFLLDEVQSNFGRTGYMFAFEAYGLEPDFVMLGKGLGNGVPVAAVVGRHNVLDKLSYGIGSDTYSANPLSCAAVQATLDVFMTTDILHHVATVSPIMANGLKSLRELPFVRQIRGEPGGMVWGVEFDALGDLTANEIARAAVLAAYSGNGSATVDGLHLLGPLAGNVLRIAPPLVITAQEAREACELFLLSLRRLR